VAKCIHANTCNAVRYNNLFCRAVVTCKNAASVNLKIISHGSFRIKS
jgi:hypothetical protein